MRWGFLLWHLRLHTDADALEPDSSLHSTGELPLKHTNELSNSHWLLTGKAALVFCDYLNERNKWCQRPCCAGIQLKPSLASLCVCNEGAGGGTKLSQGWGDALRRFSVLNPPLWAAVGLVVATVSLRCSSREGWPKRVPGKVKSEEHFLFLLPSGENLFVRDSHK